MYKSLIYNRIVCSLVFVFTLFFFQLSIAGGNLTLTLGGQRTIDAPNTKRIAVGDPAIADVKAIEKSDKILITALGVGRTNLIIWDMEDHERSILVEVIAKDPKEVAANVSRLLEGIEGIKTTVMGNRVVIDGSVLLKSDLDKITKVASLYPQVTNLAIMNPTVLNIITSQINKEFEDAGLENVYAKRLADKIMIAGDVSDEQTKGRAEEIASAFDTPIVNFIDVGVSLKKMILVNVDFIEIDKGSLTSLGIQWTDSTGALVKGAAIGSGGYGAGHSSFTGTYGFNYSATIKSIQGDKNSRILSQPKLLCRSGENAEFMAGGEVAIPLITQDTAEVEYKPYGLLLNIAPVIDKEDNIATEVEVEQSSIKLSDSGGFPSFNKSRVKTFINVKSGETIVLSGLVSNEDMKAVQKIPGLGDLPIIGELFKSRMFENKNSELVIFVTPEVIMSDQQKAVEQVDEMKKKYDAAEDDVTFHLMD
ncbi:MAG: pilus assembly protein N-terminal domain-containing protein [Desulfobacteraceae bacterium]|jgi:pilus assembly protein CpaC|nr:pilus assembly protein N-terminal domain-containing protein [Desulfobacteraceae bacterium]